MTSGHKYEYKCPATRGYRPFSISSKDQDRIFKYRKSRWNFNYEFYVKDKHIILHKIPNFIGCVASTLLFPVALILTGLMNYKEAYKDMILCAWQPKKYGAFSSDDIYKRDNDDGTFDEVMKAASYLTTKR